MELKDSIRYFFKIGSALTLLLILICRPHKANRSYMKMINERGLHIAYELGVKDKFKN